MTAAPILGYCGINCDACSVRQFGLGNGRDAFTDCCGKVPEAALKCDGCKSAQVYPGCRSCELRVCASNKKILHCAECDDFPCKRYRTWAFAAKLLPHAAIGGKNLDIVQKEGLDQWATLQRTNFTCSKCGAALSWYATACSGCGEPQGGKTYRLSGLKKLFLRVLLFATYRKGLKKETSEPLRCDNS